MTCKEIKHLYASGYRAISEDEDGKYRLVDPNGIEQSYHRGDTPPLTENIYAERQLDSEVFVVPDGDVAGFISPNCTLTDRFFEQLQRFAMTNLAFIYDLEHSAECRQAVGTMKVEPRIDISYDLMLEELFSHTSCFFFREHIKSVTKGISSLGGHTGNKHILMEFDQLACQKLRLIYENK